MSSWKTKRAPEREWVAPDRIPIKAVTLLSGDGGVGKTTLLLQLIVAAILGLEWLGVVIKQCAVLAVFCEDDEDELHRRPDSIVTFYSTISGTSFEAIYDALAERLRLISLVGEDAILAAPNKSGLIAPTPRFGQFRKNALDIQPGLIIVDNSADVYAGNENDRAQVRHFVTMLRGVTLETNSGLVMSQHPSLTGISSGTGTSGTTGWNNSCRSGMYFQRMKTDKDEEPDQDLRLLQVMKSNYAREGERIDLRWKNGLYLPVAGAGPLDKMAAEQRADQLFLSLLIRFNGQGRNCSDKLTAPTYAPTMFAKESEAKRQKIRKADFEAAMRRLFEANKICLKPFGPPSKDRSRLELQA